MLTCKKLFEGGSQIQESEFQHEISKCTCFFGSATSTPLVRPLSWPSESRRMRRSRSASAGNFTVVEGGGFYPWFPMLKHPMGRDPYGIHMFCLKNYDPSHRWWQLFHVLGQVATMRLSSEAQAISMEHWGRGTQGDWLLGLDLRRKGHMSNQL